jgi:hypothetical protein
MSRRVPLVAAARLIGSRSSVDHRKDCPRAAISSGKWESHSRHPVRAQSPSFCLNKASVSPPKGAEPDVGAASYRPTTAWPTKGKEQHCGSASSLEEGKKLCVFVSYPTLVRESARTRNSYSCNLQNDAIEADTASEIVRVSDTKRRT